MSRAFFARFAGALLLIGAMVAGSEGVLARDAESLRIAFNHDWPPYSKGAGDQVRGILPDLMDTVLGERLGISVEPVGRPWDAAQDEVFEGTLDALVTFASERRLEVLLASREIAYSLDFRAFVRAGSATERRLRADTGIDALAKERACVNRDSGWANDFFAEHGIRYDEAENLVRCLQRIDRSRKGFAILDTAAGRQGLRRAGLKGRIVMLPTVYDTVPFNLLISKRYPAAQDLLDAFDAEVSRMRGDGSLERLVEELIERDY